MLGRHFTASGGSRCRTASARTAGSYAASKLMRCICAGASNGIFQRRSKRPILIHEKQALRPSTWFVSCKYVRAVRPSLNFSSTTARTRCQFGRRSLDARYAPAIRAGGSGEDSRQEGIMGNDEDIAAAAGSLGEDRHGHKRCKEPRELHDWRSSHVIITVRGQRG